MTIAPLVHASFVIQLHVYAAIAAAILGAFVLWRKKGTRLHKALGRIWAVLMLLVAGSSFFIHTIRLWGPFSPIHLLSIATIVGLAVAIWRIRSGDVAGHRAAMRGLYVGALGIAGIFTLLPGRLMSKVFFGTGGDLHGTFFAILDGARAIFVSMPHWAWSVLTAFGLMALVALFRRRSSLLRAAAPRRSGRMSGAAHLLAVAIVACAGTFGPAPAHAATAQTGVSPIGIAAHTPLWVWLALALVLWLGYSRTKDRVVPVWRLALLPLIVTGFALANLATAAFMPFALAGLILGAAAGIGAGLAIADHTRTEYLGDGRLRLKGEWLSLAVVVLLFCVRYARGVIAATDPALAARPDFQATVLAFSGFSATLLLARTGGRFSVLARR